MLRSRIPRILLIDDAAPGIPAPTPPATPAPAPIPVDTADMTPEQIEAATSEYLNVAFNRGPSRKRPITADPLPTPVPATPPTEPTNEPPATPAPAPVVATPPVAPAPAKPAKLPKPAAAVPDLPPPVPAQPKPAPAVAAQPEPGIDDVTLELDPADELMLRIVERMQSVKPAYKDLKERIIRFWKEEGLYILQWEKAHPGQKFDESAEEHEEWYTEHEPVYSEGDYEVAKFELSKSEARVEMERTSSREKMENAFRKSLQEVQPTISKSIDAGTCRFSAQATEDLVPEIFALVDGKDEITDEISNKMEEENPAVKEILLEEAEPMALMINELNRSALVKGYGLDPKRATTLKHTDRIFYSNRELLQFISHFEDEMLKVDPKLTALDGRRLISNEQFHEHINAIQAESGSDAQKNSKLRDFNQKYYALGVDEFTTALVARYSNRARVRIAKLQKVSKKAREHSPNNLASTTQNPTPAPAATPAADLPPPVAKPRSPTISSASDVTNTNQPGENTTEQDLDNALKITMGQR